MSNYDPFTSTLQFSDGNSGRVYEDGSGTPYMRRCDITLSYSPNTFSFACNGRVASYVDLGSPDEIILTTGVAVTVGYLETYTTIMAVNGTALEIGGKSYGTFQPLVVNWRPIPSPGLIPMENHIYLIRYVDGNPAVTTQLVKMLVTGVDPGSAVYIKWDVIYTTDPANQVPCMVPATNDEFIAS